MFDLFKRKRKYSIREICNELGSIAKSIVEAASEESDIQVALKGMATISVVIAESKKEFDLEVKPNTIFSRYVLALQEKTSLQWLK